MPQRASLERILNSSFVVIKLTFEMFKLYMSLTGFALTVGALSSIGGILVKNGFAVALGGSIIVVCSLVISVLIKMAIRNPNSNFGIIRKYVTYEIHEDLKSMTHTKDITLVSTNANQAEFIDRYKWSCEKGTSHVSLLSKHQHLRQENIQEWSINRVVFDPPLYKGQETRVALKWDLHCEGESNLFLSQIVEHPTRELVLSVFLPYEPKTCEFIHFRSGDGLLTNPNSIVRKESKQDHACQYFPATREIRYRIDNPKMGHKYMITWSI